MLQKTIVFIFIACIALQSFTMELTTNTDKRDLFSQQPNKIRKQIFFPLISRCTNYNDARSILFSVGLISKKSYEQTNCIFFITDVITALAKKFDDSTEKVAVYLGTPGSLYYQKLGKSLHSIPMNNKTPREQTRELHALLSQGADINFQTACFNTTSLMKATAKSNPYLVCNLIYHGANINAKSNNKYTREHSVLYEKEELENYFYLLAKLMEKKLNENAPIKAIYPILYTSTLGTTIRNALSIDSYLEIKGGKINVCNKNTITINLTDIYKKIPLAESVHYIITNPENAK